MTANMTTNTSTANSARASSLQGQKGLSLMEMGIAATVLAALILGAVVGIQKLNFERRLGEARKQIPLTINAAVDALSGQASTASLSSAAIGTAVVSSFNAWPDDRVKHKGRTTVSVAGNFPGSSEFMLTNGFAANPRLRLVNQGYTYYIKNIPADACMPLLQLLTTHRSVAALYVGASTLEPLPKPAKVDAVTSVSTNGLLSLNAPKASEYCLSGSTTTIVALIGRS